jgi:putative peptidoglycan lipid II flippase
VSSHAGSGATGPSSPGPSNPHPSNPRPSNSHPSDPGPTTSRPSARGAAAGLLGAAGLIAALTLASRAAGFVRWLVQSWVLGSSATADAYAKANTVPNVLYEIAAGGALVGLVIPLLAAPLASGLRTEVSRRASALLCWTVAIHAPVGILVAVLARPLAGLLLGGGAPEASLDLTETFLRVFAMQIPLYGVGTVLTGVSQAHHRFAWPALAPLLSSLVVIGTYLAAGVLAGPEIDDPATVSRSIVAILAWGTTAGVIVMSLAPLVGLRGLGLSFRPTLRLDPDLRRTALGLAGAGITALLAQQVAVLSVLRATSAHPGTYNVWQYAQAAYVLPYAVLAVPLITALAPRIAERAAVWRDGATPLVATSTRAVTAVGLLGAGALVAIAPAVTGVFSARFDLPGMTTTLTVLALGLPGFALLLHASRTLYAVSRPKLATVPALSGWLLAAAGSVAAGLLADASGGSLLAALAAASAAGMTLAGLASVLTVRRALGPQAVDRYVRTFAVALVAGALAAVAGRLVTGLVLGTSAEAASLPASVLALLAGGICSVAVFAVVTLLGDRTVIDAVRRRGGKAS